MVASVTSIPPDDEIMAPNVFSGDCQRHLGRRRDAPQIGTPGYLQAFDGPSKSPISLCLYSIKFAPNAERACRPSARIRCCQGSAHDASPVVRSAPSQKPTTATRHRPVDVAGHTGA